MSDNTASPTQVKISWIIGVLLVFTIFAVIAAYSSRMTYDYTDYDQKRAAERYITLKTLQDADHAILTTADWIDQKKGTIRIPINEAMNLEIADLSAKTPEPGNLISAPPAATTTPASTNAAPVGATKAAPSASSPPAKEKK